MDLGTAPLYQALREYTEKAPLGFHMPGHTGGRAFPLTPLVTFDLTEVFLGPKGKYLPSLVKEAEDLAAEAFGAGRTFFLTNGASSGILVMLLATCPPGSRVVIGRDCHRAVVNACILGDLRPTFLLPEFTLGGELPLGVDPRRVTEALAGGSPVFLTNPNYYGVTWDLKALAPNGGVLLVDEAHGAHLALLDGYGGARKVATAWVHGTHKTLGSLTQTGMLHLRPGVDEEPYSLWLMRLGTTSPSYPLLASLDLARHWAVTQGREAWARQTERMAVLRQRLADLGWRLLGGEERLPAGVLLDPAKLTVFAPGYGMALARRLLNRHNLQVEAAGPDWVVFLVTPFHTGEELEYLFQALVDAVIPGREKRSFLPWPRRLPERLLWPREAAFAPRRRIPLTGAEGRVAAEALTPYPPGIPLVWPGEVIDQEIRSYLLAWRRMGGVVEGMDADGRVAVVAD